MSPARNPAPPRARRASARRAAAAWLALAIWIAGFELAPGLHVALHALWDHHAHGAGGAVRVERSRRARDQLADERAGRDRGRGDHGRDRARHPHAAGPGHVHDHARGGDHDHDHGETRPRRNRRPPSGDDAVRAVASRGGDHLHRGLAALDPPPPPALALARPLRRAVRACAPLQAPRSARPLVTRGRGPPPPPLA
ncbi:MAG TPA: hypothetical protein VKZ63_10330 [Kofleriaceae bacterium]|nr:hypothetical protein [Kofleriaceae bacterium]